MPVYKDFKRTINIQEVSSILKIKQAVSQKGGGPEQGELSTQTAATTVKTAVPANIFEFYVRVGDDEHEFSALNYTLLRTGLIREGPLVVIPVAKLEGLAVTVKRSPQGGMIGTKPHFTLTNPETISVSPGWLENFSKGESEGDDYRVMAYAFKGSHTGSVVSYRFYTGTPRKFYSQMTMFADRLRILLRQNQTAKSTGVSTYELLHPSDVIAVDALINKADNYWGVLW